jgi:arsenate reductase (thioredoxin)
VVVRTSAHAPRAIDASVEDALERGETVRADATPPHPDASSAQAQTSAVVASLLTTSPHTLAANNGQRTDNVRAGHRTLPAGAASMAVQGIRLCSRHNVREVVTTVPEVLFVCVHNAGRSQMAAALLGRRAGGAVHVRSAGSDPADRLNPAVVEAMTEIGLDISKEFPKPLTDEAVAAADVVITMGCGDACPFYPGKRYLDWELEDPAGKSLATVRRIRDEIDERVHLLLEELAPTRIA